MTVSHAEHRRGQALDQQTERGRLHQVPNRFKLQKNIARIDTSEDPKILIRDLGLKRSSILRPTSNLLPFERLRVPSGSSTNLTQYKRYFMSNSTTHPEPSSECSLCSSLSTSPPLAGGEPRYMDRYFDYGNDHRAKNVPASESKFTYARSVSTQESRQIQFDLKLGKSDVDLRMPNPFVMETTSPASSNDTNLLISSSTEICASNNIDSTHIDNSTAIINEINCSSQFKKHYYNIHRENGSLNVTLNDASDNEEEIGSAWMNPSNYNDNIKSNNDFSKETSKRTSKPFKSQRFKSQHFSLKQRVQHEKASSNLRSLALFGHHPMVESMQRVKCKRQPQTAVPEVDIVATLQSMWG